MVDQGRRFTVDDLDAIRDTRRIAIRDNNLDWDKETPAQLTVRWHDINNAQLWAIGHIPLPDEVIASKLHLLASLPNNCTIRDICQVYDIDPIQAKRFNGQ